MKKLTALLLVIISIACIFSGCGGSDKNDSENYSSDVTQTDSEQNSLESESEENVTSTKNFAYPTLSESLEFVQKEFPEYKDSIVCLESLGNVVLQKNGIFVGVYYEDGTFDKITSKNSDFASAFKVISDFYSEIIDYNLTATELETNMKVKTQMPNWNSYTYEDNGLSYTITVGSDYVQIQVEGIPTNAQTNTDNNSSSSVTDSNYKDSEIIGGWDYNYAYDMDTSSSTTPTDPYVSFYKFNADGSGSVTVMNGETFNLVETTWEFDYEKEEIYYYAVYLNGDKNEKLNVAYVDGVIAMQKDSALMYYEKQ